MTDADGYIEVGHEIDEGAAWDYIRDGYLLAPRTVLKGRIKFPPPLLRATPFDLNNLTGALQQTLVNAMGPMAGLPLAVMFSGGFDSMLIWLLAQQAGAKVTAVTVQFDDFNSLTVAESTRLAHQAGIAHHILHVKVVEFFSAFEALVGITDEPMLDLDLAVVYAALKKYDLRIAGNTFISGMGSCQWFGDQSAVAWPGGLAGRLDWAMTSEQAHQKVAKAHGCSFVFPFLSAPMLALSQQIPAAMKKDKRLLRSLATGSTISHHSGQHEIQVPESIRRILVKMYGHRAWPGPVLGHEKRGHVTEQVLRQIVLGLWQEKWKGS